MLTLTRPNWKALLLGISMGLPLWASAQQAQLPIQPAVARSLATRDLTRVLEWLPPDHLEQYGFDYKDDFSAISVGTPLYRASFSDESVIKGAAPQMQTDVVLLPLSLNGTVRCFVYLSPDADGRWTTTGLGGHNEASTWSTLFSERALGKSDHLTMLHIPQNNADYLWYEGSGAWQDVSVGPGHNSGQILHADELFQQAVQIAAEARATTGENAGG